ncbi:aquaporin-3-like isoform X2 [Chiloscyllium plagiosum]|uniref:aquaporin-3-like isoform X2 n=1 Tax=Chiloscyllium plagiosum TaxID=36176 RepID=UPI001CB85C28|nr:aquaporin-3-like isoform X2 [Chiloscyllium plagiosum]
MERQKEIIRNMTTILKVQSLLLKQCLAECLGTLIHTMLSCGGVAQFTLSYGTHKEFLTVTIAGGFAVALGILVTSKVSGAFLGSGIMFGLYYDTLWHYGNKQLTVIGANSTAGIFTTYPHEHLSAVNGIFNQAIGTAALILCILIIVDPLNDAIPTGLEAFTIGFVVLLIGWSMGSNSQYSLNPARDIGPRLFTAIAGWGTEAFTAGNYWFWIPVASPIIGAIFGVLLYKFIVGLRAEARTSCPSNAEQNIKLMNQKPKRRL